MQPVLLVIHLMIAAALVGVVLLQRSEGGALGMGGGGGSGFMTGRGAANLLTRTTAILAGCFFATSLLLAIISSRAPAPTVPDAPPATTTPAPTPAAVPGPTPAKPGEPSAPPAKSDAPPAKADAPAVPTPPAAPAKRGGILDKLGDPAK